MFGVRPVRRNPLLFKAMEVTLLGTGGANSTADKATSAYFLKHGGTTVLMDCGEGALGLRGDKPPKVEMVDAICFTHDHTDHLSGLMSVLRRMSMSRKTPIEIYGPESAVKKARALAEISGDMAEGAVNWHTIAPGQDYQIGELTLRPFSTVHTDDSVGLLFETQPPKAKIDQVKAREAGIKPGPDMGKLQKGESVTLPDGKVVSPADVLLPAGTPERMAYTGDTKFHSRIANAVADVDLLLCDCTYLKEHEVSATEHSHCTAEQVGQLAQMAGVKMVVGVHTSPRYEKEEVALMVSEIRATYSGVAENSVDGQRFDISAIRRQVVREQPQPAGRTKPDDRPSTPGGIR